MGFWLLHINTSSIVRRTIYTTALGIKSLFTPIILEHPPELYQSSGTLWRWVYATFRFFYIYIARLFIYLGSFGPTPHPSTPAHQQKKYTGEIKKKYYKLSRRQNIIINPGDMYTPQQQQQLSDNILINIHGNAAARE